MLLQLSWSDPPETRERMIGPANQHEQVASEDQLDNFGMGCTLDQSTVQGAGPNLGADLHRRLDNYVQAHPREPLRKRSQPLREVKGRAGGARTEVKRSSLEHLDRPNRIVHHLKSALRGPGGDRKRPAGIGECYAAASALEQAQPERPFEVVDLLGDRALSQM